MNTKHEVDKWKKFHKYYSLNVRGPLEIDATPYISSHNSMFWGYEGMPKSRSGMDVISNRWESISLVATYLFVLETFKFMTLKRDFQLPVTLGV